MNQISKEDQNSGIKTTVNLVDGTLTTSEPNFADTVIEISKEMTPKDANNVLEIYHKISINNFNLLPCR